MEKFRTGRAYADWGALQKEQRVFIEISESFLAIFTPAIYNKITSDKRTYFLGGQHGLYIGEGAC